MLNQLKRLNRRMVVVFLTQPFLLLAMNTHANSTRHPYENRSYLTHTLNEILYSPSKHLLSDTAGASMTLSIGTATDRNIAYLDLIQYYSSTDCATGQIGTTTDISGGDPFVFEDATPFFFGQEALSAMSAGDVATQCISLVPNQSNPGAAAYVFLRIQNLTCNGTTCTGGTVCRTGSANLWDASAIPVC